MQSLYFSVAFAILFQRKGFDHCTSGFDKFGKFNSSLLGIVLGLAITIWNTCMKISVKISCEFFYKNFLKINWKIEIRKKQEIRWLQRNSRGEYMLKTNSKYIWLIWLMHEICSNLTVSRLILDIYYAWYLHAVPF